MLSSSMKALWRHYSAGNVSKEDLDTHQAAIDETKSEQQQKQKQEQLFSR